MYLTVGHPPPRILLDAPPTLSPELKGIRKESQPWEAENKPPLHKPVGVFMQQPPGRLKYLAVISLVI